MAEVVSNLESQSLSKREDKDYSVEALESRNIGRQAEINSAILRVALKGSI
jgi:hypothetical protein